MSASAHAARPEQQQYVHGSAAPAGRPGASPRQAPRRTPLSVVPNGPARKRVPFALFCFTVLVLALGSVLVLNISVSSGQYKLVELRNEQVSLAQANEKLTQQLENNQAPQNLAAKAADLGMVTSPSVGSIDLGSQKVAGKPKAAEPGAAPELLVAQPENPGHQPAAKAETGKQGGEAAAAKPTAQSAAAAEAAAAEKAAQNKAPQNKAAQKKAANKNDEKQLNGGSIPAPKQQSGQ
ncbi:hypothetical protein [Arthrobacter sulfonylureivorans]|uniref:Cell division protein FtsL n=1 Tax=Arthrobacter sulfonylureivorans TaxID=2486855 RepID=A0ABY3W8Q7_9MICC|nr:hypothetical protein [Arthrobacter sulfonylureivorans]UNK44702.1 hypothetical protein MNQ99_12020 [Arthrobacter sulfonylureivorans]